MYPYFLFIALTILMPADKSNMIDWSGSRKLTWTDFEGTPDRSSDNAALTSSHINFQFGYGTNDFNYTIRCTFDKKRSWVRVRSPYILNHEQRHFDIAEIHARKLKKALTEYRYNEKTVEDVVTGIHETIMKEHHVMQAKFDLESDHSRKRPEQIRWDRRIDSLLKAYSAFSKYR